MSNYYGSSEYFKVQLVDDADGTITGEDGGSYIKETGSSENRMDGEVDYSEEYVSYYAVTDEGYEGSYLSGTRTVTDYTMAEEPVTTITVYGADQEILKQTDADGNVLDPSMLFDLSTWTTAANAVEDFASSIGISMDYAQEEFEQSILDTILNPMGSPEFVTNDAGAELQGMDITGSMFAAEIRGTFEATYDLDSDDWELSSGTITSIKVYPVTFGDDGSPVVGEELVTSNTSLDVACLDVAAVIMAGGDYEEENIPLFPP